MYNVNYTSKNMKNKKGYRFVKRLVDIVLSIILIIVFSIIVWSWLIIINLFFTKGHPFFVSNRIGKNKKVFKILKFRSMRLDTPILSPYDTPKEEIYSYETKFGKFLRKSSLDETLQFFNILVGQMSFIGPRPGAAEGEELLVKARDSIEPSSFLVRPGLTGLSQTYYKRDHDVYKKAELDSKYVKELSFVTDLKIFLKTFGVIFKGR